MRGLFQKLFPRGERAAGGCQGWGRGRSALRVGGCSGLGSCTGLGLGGGQDGERCGEGDGAVALASSQLLVLGLGGDWARGRAYDRGATWTTCLVTDGLDLGASKWAASVRCSPLGEPV